MLQRQADTENAHHGDTTSGTVVIYETKIHKRILRKARTEQERDESYRISQNILAARQAIATAKRTEYSTAYADRNKLLANTIAVQRKRSQGFKIKWWKSKRATVYHSTGLVLSRCEHGRSLGDFRLQQFLVLKHHQQLRIIHLEHHTGDLAHIRSLIDSLNKRIDALT